MIYVVFVIFSTILFVAALGFLAGVAWGLIKMVIKIIRR